eukprot:TRINITY_DN754_c0_g1_i1.p1 TRINITY_DN754_c0_g1~~TRINITY_DN754_c0_g1_i1.p1  ORF type:complete len:346 (-),score=60.79 TRINITY_DN754_c0_g1_i1:576-1613(-)
MTRTSSGRSLGVPFLFLLLLLLLLTNVVRGTIEDDTERLHETTPDSVHWDVIDLQYGRSVTNLIDHCDVDGSSCQVDNGDDGTAGITFDRVEMINSSGNVSDVDAGATPDISSSANAFTVSSHVDRFLIHSRLDVTVSLSSPDGRDRPPLASLLQSPSIPINPSFLRIATSKDSSIVPQQQRRYYTLSSSRLPPCVDADSLNKSMLRDWQTMSDSEFNVREKDGVSFLRRSDGLSGTHGTQHWTVARISLTSSELSSFDLLERDVVHLPFPVPSSSQPPSLPFSTSPTISSSDWSFYVDVTSLLQRAHDDTPEQQQQQHVAYDSIRVQLYWNELLYVKVRDPDTQ